MSSKSGVVKKKGGKKKSPATPKARLLYDSALDRSELSSLLRSHETSELLELQLKLLQWTHSTLSATLPLSATLMNVARVIESHHGRVSGLQFFTTPSSNSASSSLSVGQSAGGTSSPDGVPKKPSSELTDWTTPLAKIQQNLGLTVGGSGSASRLTLWYDFKPSVVSPILLKEPNLFRKETGTETAKDRERDRDRDRDHEEHDKKMSEDYHQEH